MKKIQKKDSSKKGTKVIGRGRRRRKSTIDVEENE